MERPWRFLHLVLLGLIPFVGAFLSCSKTPAFELSSYQSPTEITAGRANLIGKRVKVYGLVKAGSLMHRPGTLDYRFELSDLGSSIRVTARGIIPPQLAEGREATAEGTLAADGILQANRVLTKCPSKYRGRIKPE